MPLKRVIDSHVGVFALLVDAKDDQAVAFYKHYGFLSLESQPEILFLSISAAIQALFEN